MDTLLHTGRVETHADMQAKWEEKVHDAFRLLLTQRHKRVLAYAVGYARLGTSMHTHTLYTQVLHVLANMIYWRGEMAKGVREVLKGYVTYWKEEAEKCQNAD